ncbi:FAD-linked oxidoreductase [Mycobacterium persicum]|uniref:FAD-linked oxidoreductase n=2 Tax=Mycobacterium persicum TaxID=1487726 RepID=A0A8E2ITB9_9MYCO|nr:MULTISPECIES: FAD-binding oxidoreductase [Mycobacterium]ORB52068.1 FAD-linked oxidoreductase [Mycobacterium persicum]ORB96424.1 FAD-linked oxidoreductase [Mycobacterium persicum]ORC03121.1 FAD-linked oxidoreductase [Mycobacterium persicum]ORC08533.1 FAD-linked oxidoreductase [Mycobacterium persicum]
MRPMISRQAFLRGAVGALATSAVFGQVRAAADPSSGWSGLASSIGGRVLLPGSGGSFTSGKQVFNSLYNGSNPAAVVTVTSQADVEKAVAFAAANKLKIAPRGGGHSYIGASAAAGAMVIDLRGLTGGVNFDSATGNVTMPAATELYAAQQALAGAGRAIPTGSCPTVGVGGLTLGGGMGADSRHAGLTCDALKSATVVLPSGQTVTASADDHPDLFWALRGGGGGNFGVTTSMTFATFPTADSDVVRVDFAPSSAARVLTGWQTWLAAADRNTWGLVDMSVGGSQANCHVLATCPAGSGPGVADAIKSAVGVQPTGTEHKTLSHMDLVMYLAGGSSTSSPRGFVAGSDVIGTVNSAAAQAIVAALGKWPPASGRASVIVDTLSGAVGDIDPAGSAFPWRRQSAVAQWYVETPNSGQAAVANNWLSAAHQAVQQFSVGAYVNYLEPNTAPSRYFGPNLSRLTEIRQRYDPNRLMYSGLNF